MPPPVTPSPHRFINKPKSQRPPNLPSSLQHHQHPPSSSSKQFKPTPRFSVPSAPRREVLPAAAAPSSPLVARGKRPTRDRGHKEATNFDNKNESPDAGDEEHELPTIEPKDASKSNHRKRRRLSPEDPPATTSKLIYISDDNAEHHSTHSPSSTDSSSSSPPQLPPTRSIPSWKPSTRTTQTPKSLPHQAVQTPSTLAPHRFLLSTPHQSAQTDQDFTPPTRPIFLLPTSNASEPSETDHPLPEAFSPHRRGQKFIPGGLASEVREWVIQTSQTSLHNRRQEEFAVKVIVEEVRRGNGMLVMKGKVNGREKKIILAEGEKNGSVGRELREGCLVGIRAPVWDLEVLGEKWGFGVQWVVIDGG
ncbi:MAG: hypothetical protein M1812_006926 [Candelaria pacifica]|nr:MAG: hypothetical protein M1812_006926 [Candelaria pacifica]